MTLPAALQRFGDRLLGRGSAAITVPVMDGALKANRVLDHAEVVAELPGIDDLASDGETLYAFRYSNNETPNTLYYRESQENVVIVSEPLDTERAFWKAVPQAHLIIARPHGTVEMLPFPEVARVAAE